MSILKIFGKFGIVVGAKPKLVYGWLAGMTHTPARKNLLTGVVEFRLHKAGSPHAGNLPAGFWIETHSDHFDEFIEDKGATPEILPPN